MSKGLGIVFSTILINAPRKKVHDRFRIYKMAFESIIRHKPANLDLIFIDNSDFQEYARKNSNPVVRDLNSLFMGQQHLIYPGNTGMKNKGFGELDMMNHVCKSMDLSVYDHIQYITGRQIHTTNLMLNLHNVEVFDIAAGNPKFYFLNGEVQDPGDEESMNDMFFIMKSDFFVRYCEFFEQNRKNMSTSKTFGSEQLLWNFMQGVNHEHYKIENMGILRNATNELSRIGSWHLI